LTSFGRVQAFGLCFLVRGKYAARVAEATNVVVLEQLSRTPSKRSLGQRGFAGTAALEEGICPSGLPSDPDTARAAHGLARHSNEEFDAKAG